MASKFKITTYRNSKNLCLKLIGEFDASSAWILFDELKKNADKFNHIIINTDSLKKVYPFGVHIFHQALKDLSQYRVYLLFSGKKADQISPENYA